MNEPRTVKDWKAIAGGLSGEPLMAAVIGVNCVTFVKALLQEDGFQPGEVTAILRAFAERLVEDDQEVPGRVEGSYCDLRMLLP